MQSQKPSSRSPDPALQQLLDEGLAPPPVPPGLVDRIVGATCSPGAAPANPVLARLAWRSLLPVAAVIAVAATALLAVWPQPQPASRGVEPGDGTLAVLEQLDADTAVTQSRDFGEMALRVEVLALQLALAGGPGWGEADQVDLVAGLPGDMELALYEADADDLF